MRKLRNGLCVIISISIALLVCIVYALFIPFDIIRYHRMAYYRDFKIKYRIFLTSNDVVKLYNRIVREKLPIAYFKNHDLEYFVKDGQVLLCGWGYDGFEESDGQWYFVLDEERNTQITMLEVIEDESEHLKPEHKDLPVRFLVFYSDMTDTESAEQAKKCPYFYYASSVEEVF